MKVEMTDLEIIGFQILGPGGWSIHGNADDPFRLNSYDVLFGNAVEVARAWAEAHPGYEIAPVLAGDVEERRLVEHIHSESASEPGI